MPASERQPATPSAVGRDDGVPGALPTTLTAARHGPLVRARKWLVDAMVARRSRQARATLEAMPGLTRPRVIEGIPALSQPEVANDVKAFFAEHPIPEAVRNLTQKLEMLEINVTLRERETAVVSKYFE